MPDTITAFNVFARSTKARSSEVNENFNNYRGTLLPINTGTATASDLTHDLGSDSHRWSTGYVGTVDLKSSTSTASLQITGDTSNTTGAILFKVGGNTVAQVTQTGIPAASIRPSEILIWTTYTVASLGTTGATLIIPTNGSVEYIYPFGCGTGGGGGAGAGYTAGSDTSGGGGGGGGSVPYFAGPIAVVAGETLSITIGQVGSGLGVGGAGTTSASNGANGGSGQSCRITRSGVDIFNTGAGSGGAGGVLGTTGGPGAGGTGGVAYFGFMVTDGGDGGAGDSDGEFGAGSVWASIGLRGVSGPGAGGGGGGGGAGYGRGGQGGNGGAGGAGSNGATATAYGAGGGGGGAADAAGTAGGSGGDGGPAILMIGYIR